MVMSKPIVLNLVFGRPNKYFSKKFFQQYKVRLNPYKRGLTKEELIKEIKDVEPMISSQLMTIFFPFKVISFRTLS